MENLKQFLNISILSMLATQASAGISLAQIPEPATLSLLGIGLFSLGLARRKMKHTDSSK